MVVASSYTFLIQVYGNSFCMSFFDDYFILSLLMAQELAGLVWPLIFDEVLKCRSLYFEIERHYVLNTPVDVVIS